MALLTLEDPSGLFLKTNLYKESLILLKMPHSSSGKNQLPSATCIQIRSETSSHPTTPYCCASCLSKSGRLRKWAVLTELGSDILEGGSSVLLTSPLLVQLVFTFSLRPTRLLWNFRIAWCFSNMVFKQNFQNLAILLTLKVNGKKII